MGVELLRVPRKEEASLKVGVGRTFYIAVIESDCDRKVHCHSAKKGCSMLTTASNNNNVN